MTAENEKKEGTPPKPQLQDDLHTDEPISERDEVKKAEDRTRQVQKDTGTTDNQKST